MMERSNKTALGVRLWIREPSGDCFQDGDIRIQNKRPSGAGWELEALIDEGLTVLEVMKSLNKERRRQIQGRRGK